MIKATLHFGLESENYKKIDLNDGKTGWTCSQSYENMQKAHKILDVVMAENYPTMNYSSTYWTGEDNLSEYSNEGYPMAHYVITLFGTFDFEWSMKYIQLIENQLNIDCPTKFVFAKADVDFDHPDGVWCTACIQIGSDCKICNGEKIITYESLLND